MNEFCSTKDTVIKMGCICNVPFVMHTLHNMLYELVDLAFDLQPLVVSQIKADQFIVLVLFFSMSVC